MAQQVKYRVVDIKDSWDFGKVSLGDGRVVDLGHHRTIYDAMTKMQQHHDIQAYVLADIGARELEELVCAYHYSKEAGMFGVLIANRASNHAVDGVKWIVEQFFPRRLLEVCSEDQAKRYLDLDVPVTMTYSIGAKFLPDQKGPKRMLYYFERDAEWLQAYKDQDFLDRITESIALGLGDVVEHKGVTAYPSHPKFESAVNALMQPGVLDQIIAEQKWLAPQRFELFPLGCRHVNFFAGILREDSDFEGDPVYQALTQMGFTFPDPFMALTESPSRVAKVDPQEFDRMQRTQRDLSTRMVPYDLRKKPTGPKKGLSDEAPAAAAAAAKQ